MKTYIYLFLLLLATASWSEQTAPDHSVGYLRVENIILSCDTETLPITRAVDAGLKQTSCRYSFPDQRLIV